MNSSRKPAQKENQLWALLRGSYRSVTQKIGNQDGIEKAAKNTRKRPFLSPQMRARKTLPGAPCRRRVFIPPLNDSKGDCREDSKSTHEDMLESHSEVIQASMGEFFTRPIRRYDQLERPDHHSRGKSWPLLMALRSYEGNKNSMMRLASRIGDGKMTVMSLQGHDQFFRWGRGRKKVSNSKVEVHGFERTISNQAAVLIELIRCTMTLSPSLRTSH